jgi:hypothetical protein
MDLNRAERESNGCEGPRAGLPGYVGSPQPQGGSSTQIRITTCQIKLSSMHHRRNNLFSPLESWSVSKTTITSRLAPFITSASYSGNPITSKSIVTQQVPNRPIRPMVSPFPIYREYLDSSRTGGSDEGYDKHPHPCCCFPA